MIFEKVLARVKSIISSILFFRDRKIEIKKGLTILTPPGHRLKEYREVHPRYDKFLGELSAILPSQSVVLDIGANVGDSLALMGASNPNLNVLCVEPDPYFLRYLKKNMQIVLNNEFKGEIEVVKSFAGSPKSGSLVGGATTKVFKTSDAGVVQIFSTLEELAHLALEKFESPKVKLVKIDVDGYDWEVLDSGMDFIAKDNPIIFFEALIIHADGLEGLGKTVESLHALDYSFGLFDNFGNFVLESNLPTVINQLFSYTFLQEAKSSSPIQYFDVLAVPSKEMPSLLRHLNLIP
jgi:FkbM family methyltransferase